MNDRQAMTAIFYLLRTSCQWKALPRSLGAASTMHDRFQWWREEGVFYKLWQAGLAEFDVCVGLDWEWLAMDGAMTKAPLAVCRREPYFSRNGTTCSSKLTRFVYKW